MTPKDWITVILAFYGASLSSYLAYREIQKERRRIKMILEHVAIREIVRLIIVNSGHRPVTLTDIKVGIPEKGNDGIEFTQPVPSHAIFNSLSPEFPKLLSDGQSVIYELGSVLSGIMIEKFIRRGKVFISLYDAEGNVYTKYERRQGNAKWGGSEKIGK